jgi:mRNA-degrading endonuclease toxin of MazEF toxin-antitoxin module
MKRGEIYWADLAPRSGSEQRGRRPVLVLSHDGFNLTPGWRSVAVVPLSTSEGQTRRGPTAVEVATGAESARRSIALCHQITTLDRGKLSEYVGTLTREDLSRVEAGVKAALDLN